MHNLILGCDIDNAANFCTYENQRHIWPGARISGVLPSTEVRRGDAHHQGNSAHLQQQIVRHRS